MNPTHTGPAVRLINMLKKFGARASYNVLLESVGKGLGLLYSYTLGLHWGVGGGYFAYLRVGGGDRIKVRWI